MRWMLTLLLLPLLGGCLASLEGKLPAAVGRQIGQEVAPSLPPPAAATAVQGADGDWCAVMARLRWPDPTLKFTDLGPSARAPVLRIYTYGDRVCPGWAT